MTYGVLYTNSDGTITLDPLGADIVSTINGTATCLSCPPMTGFSSYGSFWQWGRRVGVDMRRLDHIHGESRPEA